ncbi:MAG TPA: Cu(I)-responsive transcriptional regulator, partial [Rhodobacteraceae bacterium]|nr:Cu(I)-responsive transcriptional regulator [Paracoccaceae bacterium]
VALYQDDQRESAEVKRIAGEHLAQIDAKITELQSLRATLAHLIHACA